MDYDFKINSMKITQIETIPVRVPLRPQFIIRSARGEHATSPFLLVLIHTDVGLVGLGEVSCTPRWSGEDQISAGHFIHHLFAPLLVGQNPADCTRLEALMARALARNSFTRAGVEMALWDLAAKAANLPLFALLGGRVRDCVPLKWSISGQEPERAASIADWGRQQGFRAMKVKVGLERDRERVALVRGVLGDDFPLGVDANGAWTCSQAVRCLDALADLRLWFVEQPVAEWNIEGMAEVRRIVRLPVIADESVYSPQDACRIVRARAADVISIYVGKAGGIGPACRIAAVAAAAGLLCSLGSNLELGVGSAAMLHLALALPEIACEQFPCDIIGPHFYEADVIRRPMEFRQGSLWPLAGPGLGVELDPDQVERFRLR